MEFAQAEGIADPCVTRFAVDLVEALSEVAEVDEAQSLLEWYESNAVRLGFCLAGRDRTGAPVPRPTGGCVWVHRRLARRV